MCMAWRFHFPIRKYDFKRIKHGNPIFKKMQKLFKTLEWQLDFQMFSLSLGVQSKNWVQQQIKPVCPGLVLSRTKKCEVDDRS